MSFYFKVSIIVGLVITALLFGILIWFAASKMKLLDVKAWKAGADAFRDWLALLFVPVLLAYAVWMTALVVFLFPWEVATEKLRLYITGGALMLTLVLIGLGTFFLQRRSDPYIRVEGLGGEFELGGKIEDGTRVEVAAGSTREVGSDDSESASEDSGADTGSAKAI